MQNAVNGYKRIKAKTKQQNNLSIQFLSNNLAIPVALNWNSAGGGPLPGTGLDGLAPKFVFALKLKLGAGG